VAPHCVNIWKPGKTNALRNVGMASVRPRVALISLLAGALGACALDTSRPPRLSYAPPEAPSAELGPAAARQPAGLIWNQLLDRLIQSDLEIDLADPERGIIVARYSGDPEPYVTCGWILVDRGGELEQVPASGEASFKRVVQGRRLEVNRDLNLDARLVVEVQPDGDGAAVETTSNYVLTKTVATDQSRVQEVVSFSSGGRGEFSKGTVCQPNGALERTVLDVLPRATQTAQADGRGPVAMVAPQAQGSAPTARIEVVESAAPAPTVQATDGSAPASDSLAAESAAPAPGTQSSESSPRIPDGQSTESAAPASAEQTASREEPGPAGQTGEADAGPAEAQFARAEQPDSAMPEVEARADPGTTSGCPIDDRTFCEVLDLTDPYRRANQERDLGLALDALEPDNPLLDGGGLGIDISLPNYDSYLTVSYFLKDGTVRHVLAGWSRRWPANAREFVPALEVDDRQSVELVIALASDVPVFPSPRPSSEAAQLYLSDLRARLSELSNGGAPAQIAASLIVITPA
jgi:hypothetical protein